MMHLNLVWSYYCNLSKTVTHPSSQRIQQHIYHFFHDEIPYDIKVFAYQVMALQTDNIYMGDERTASKSCVHLLQWTSYPKSHTTSGQRSVHRSGEEAHMEICTQQHTCFHNTCAFVYMCACVFTYMCMCLLACTCVYMTVCTCVHTCACACV